MNKKRSYILALLLLCVFSLNLFISCDTVKEASTSIELADDLFVLGRTGQDVDVEFTLKMKNASGVFKKAIPAEGETGAENLINWIYVPGFDISTTNLKLYPTVAVRAGYTSATFHLSGSSSWPFNYSTFVIKVPSAYVNDRLNEVVVDTTGKRTLINIIADNDTVSSFARMMSTTNATGLTATQYVGEEIDSTTFKIQLENNSFNKDYSKDYDIRGWFTNAVPGLKYALANDIKAGSNECRIVVSGRPEIPYQGDFKIKISSGMLTTENNDMWVVVPTSVKYRILSSTYAEVTKTLVIDTPTSVPVEGKNTVFSVISVNLPSSESFKAPDLATGIRIGDDLSTWFVGKDNKQFNVPGLSYTALSRIQENTKNNLLTFDILISGTPLTNVDAPILIQIPAAYLKSGHRLTVNTKDSRYLIEATKGLYDWRLFDLATFGNTDAEIDENGKYKNPNAALTKDGKGAELKLQKDNSIASGSGTAMTYSGGLTRYGYRLKGFTYRYRWDASPVDPTNIVYKWTNEDIENGECALDDDTWVKGIEDIMQGQLVDLFAVWEPDPAVWGWKTDENGDLVKDRYGNITKVNDTSNGGKLLPVTFDVEKAYPDDADKGIDAEYRSHFENYPYYNEAKVVAAGYTTPEGASLDYTDSATPTFKYDYMIGEHPITGYMLDELRKWNSSATDKGGFELPTEEPSNPTNVYGKPASDFNYVGYGIIIAPNTGSPSNTKPLNEKSQPLTYVSTSQAIIIANAMTAYYNAHSDSQNQLTYAYVKTPGSNDPVKTLADAEVLMATATAGGATMIDINAENPATGFRLPANSEWEFAARAVPDSDYDSAITGAYANRLVTDLSNNVTIADISEKTADYMYPQVQVSASLSGDPTFDPSLWVYGKNQSAKLDPFAYYLYNSGIYGASTNAQTHGFVTSEIYGKPYKAGTISGRDKKPNNIGVYGMSGNVWEPVDKVNTTNISYRILRGGSCFNNARQVPMGSIGLTYKTDSFRQTASGIRLVRTLAPATSK